MAADGKTTQIDKNYLNSFRTYIQTLISTLRNDVMTSGTSYSSDGSGKRPALDGNIKVSAGTDAFPAAAILNKKLAEVGGSVATQLGWLDKLLEDMDTELGHTISGFEKNETFNKDTVDKFVQDFPTTIADLKSPSTSDSSSNTATSSKSDAKKGA